MGWWRRNVASGAAVVELDAEIDVVLRFLLLLVMLLLLVSEY